MEPSKLKCLFKVWGHSREEDADGLTVYRPADYNFPLSRGRDGMEFRPDATIMDVGPGPDDRSRRTTGSWKSLGDDALDVRVGGSESAPRRMTIVDCDDLVLRVRWE
jgi:hypothetical protein